MSKKFHLRVFDNFHYGDDSDFYDYGEYNTYEDAVVGAKAIIMEFLRHNYIPGMSAGSLYAAFVTFGEEPVILPNEPGGRSIFSARSFVEEMVKLMC